MHVVYLFEVLMFYVVMSNKSRHRPCHFIANNAAYIVLYVFLKHELAQMLGLRLKVEGPYRSFSDASDYRASARSSLVSFSLEPAGPVKDSKLDTWLVHRSACSNLRNLQQSPVVYWL